VLPVKKNKEAQMVKLFLFAVFPSVVFPKQCTAFLLHNGPSSFVTSQAGVTFTGGEDHAHDGVISTSMISSQSRRRRGNFDPLYAKKRKRDQEAQAQDMELFNKWYDRVEQDATPDDVFWDEMERQKRSTADSSNPDASATGSTQTNTSWPNGDNNVQGATNSNSAASSAASQMQMPANANNAGDSYNPSNNPSTGNNMNMNPDATLQALSYAAVSGSGSSADNDSESGWSVDEEDDNDEDEEMELQRRLLDEELDRLLAESEDGNTFENTDEEIWDRWAGAESKEEEDEEDEMHGVCQCVVFCN
jgi:hypothetical protein